MNTTGSLLLFVVLAAVLVAAWQALRRRYALKYIEYLGERFALPKTYWTYETDRNDSENLRPEDVGRIESLMSLYEFKPVFPSERSFGDAAFGLKFPGYGLANLKVEAEAQKWHLVSLEIPQVNKYRYLLAETCGADVRLRDSFVLGGKPIVRARVHDGQVAYVARDLEILREQAL
jgi:hypothetical protein